MRNPARPQEKAPFFLGRTTDALKAYEVDRSFIDRPALLLEQDHLKTKLIEAAETRSQAIIHVDSTGEAKRWDKVDKKIDDLMDIISIEAGIMGEMEQGNPNGRSFLEIGFHHAVEFGGEVALRRALREELNLARRAGQEEAYTPYAELVDFATCFISSAKIDGISLEDFMDPTISKKSTVPFFQFLAVASTQGARASYDEFLSDNNEVLAAQYPNSIMWNINVLATKAALFLGNIQSEHLLSQAKSCPEPLDECYKNAARLLEGVNIVREKARKALLNPKDLDSAALREIVKVFLQSPQEVERNQILQLIGINRVKNIVSVYRQAYELSSGEDGEFYYDLAIVVRNFVDEISSIQDILNDDDVDFFLSNQSEQVSTDKKFEEHLSTQGKYINALTNITRNRFFEVNPATVDMGRLAIPELIEVKFDQNRPRKYTINLIYNNDLNEEVEIQYTVDTSRGTFDWNFLEDPINPENAAIASMRDALVPFATKLISNILLEETEKKQLSKSIQSHQMKSARPEKRERFEDPIYDLRKKVRAEKRAEMAAATDEIEITPKGEKMKVKNRFILDDEDLSKKIHVGTDDAKLALEGIREYNERGVGKFTRKRKKGPDGKPRYTLRVAHMRVLGGEKESGEGFRNFEILDIRDRKDVYSKNQL